MHVDEFIDCTFGTEKYARWMFSYFRLPAVLKNDFAKFMEDNRLFCTYNGKRMRCTGASRLGDVWITSDHMRNVGYDRRVMVENCSNWSQSKDEALNEFTNWGK